MVFLVGSKTQYNLRVTCMCSLGGQRNENRNTRVLRTERLYKCMTQVYDMVVGVAPKVSEAPDNG